MSPDNQERIVRSRRPLNLETAVAALDHRLTPNDGFFVRSHFGAPAVEPEFRLTMTARDQADILAWLRRPGYP